MNDEAPRRRTPAARSSFRRKLRFRTRVRNRVREIADRVLGADLVWSLALVAVMLGLLSSQRCGTPYDRYVIGEKAPYDIRARFDFEVPDPEATETRREQARSSVPEVWVHDFDRGLRLARELSSMFETGRASLAPQEPDTGQAGGEPALPEHLDSPTRAVLTRLRFSEDTESALSDSVREVMRSLVVGNKALLEREESILIVHVPGNREERLSDFERIMDLDEARNRVRALVRGGLQLGRQAESVLTDLAVAFVDANLSYDPERTLARRDAAARAMSPVMIEIPRGTVLVRKDQRFTQKDVDRVEAARIASQGRMGLSDLLGLLAILSMLAFFLYRYTCYHQRAFRSRLPQLHALLVLIMLSILVLGQGILWVASQVVGGMRPPFDNIDAYAYLIPLGAGAVLVTLLANGRIAVVYSAYTAVLFGALQGWDLHFMIWGIMVQFAGVYAISTYRNRAALLRAGLVLGGAGAATCLALEVLRGGVEPLGPVLFGSGLAFLGGAVGAGLLISFTLPLLESLFRVLTDIRLLELSNVDNPLLSQLAVKAPGSYNHSLVVGHLAEEGAKAIGANSLFCRVAAFYHDIGKMMKPEYYVENQRGENPHDRLSPSMSALIISSHVKEGIAMAREAGLHPQIIDIIPQHHGTRRMTYFYERARAKTDRSHGPVNENDFRYPGPKPQSREAAIFMLADAVEAAARTVEEPTANRLREMIRKVSNAIVLDGQFDECDLTFVDLDRIQEAFLRTLVSMYHHRVDYPGFDFRKGRDGRAPAAGHTAAEVGAGSRREAEVAVPAAGGAPEPRERTGRE